ncbi:MAG TPA: hypothetical protein DF613_15675 [Lachnospiraceae bacterium]|nr:hypothetical protein [Lachnospiraceae bacterium]
MFAIRTELKTGKTRGGTTMAIHMETLTKEQIARIHELTLELLGKQGIVMLSDHAVDTFRAHGAKVDGNRVFIPAEMIEDAIRSTPSEFTVCARNREKDRKIGTGYAPALAPTGGVPMVQDETGQHTVTWDDFRTMLKLTQTSPVVNMACSGAIYPVEKNAHEAIQMMLYHTVNMTDLPLIGNTEYRSIAEDTVQIAKIATGMEEDKHFAVGICNSLSPMGWDGKMLDGIRTMAEHNQPVNISCCAMAGATAPIYLMGCVLEANAEVLAGIVYSQLLRPGLPVIYGTTSSVMDMQSMGLTLGTPEYTLISSSCAQMAHHYGIPFRSSGGLTDAKELDAQAGMESAANLICGFASDVNFMLQSVGIYQSFMTIGWDKWLLDEEIMARLLFIRKGIGEIPEDLLEVVSDGVEAGDFLGEPSTVTDFRSELYWPKLADRRSYKNWKDEKENFRGLAWAKVHERLDSYVQPELQPDVKAGLEKYLTGVMGHKLPTF